MMIFRNPEWLALVPVLALALWYGRRWRWHRPLRVALLALLVLILVRPQWRGGSGGMDLWVLLDRSASTEGRVEQSLPEWRKLLNSAKRSKSDELHFVDYAADVLPQEVAAGQPFTGNRDFTRTGLALQSALALRDATRPSRILVFTDGYSTESLAGLADKLVRDNVPVDVRFLNDTPGNDFRLTRLTTPPRVQMSEAFLLEIAVAGPESISEPVALTILRDGKILMETKVDLKKGQGLARFTDRVREAGGHRYEAMISPEQDTHPGNNRLEAWTEVVGGPRLLLITKYPDDPVATALRQQKFEVEVVSQPSTLQAGKLAGCRAVMFHNVPAHEVPADFLTSLDFFVNEQGGGLLMAGGRQSFGSGGYFHSAIDPLLPVSMELKTDQRKTAVSMAIVMDRSGSMGAPVAGGGVKMDLANEGAAKAIEMLGYMDSVAVLAVDSEAHEPVSMQQIGDESNKSTLMKICRRISVGGGGIFTYTGLKAGWRALKDTNYGTRHLILFADASDAEEPGDYIKLLEEMTKAGATVSVIALGTKADSDAAFLEDVALRGKGRIFFTDKAAELPNIFTQETVAVARSAFLEEAVPCQPTGGWVEISPQTPAWLTPVDAYNLSYKKSWASQALITADEYAAPLVCWGQRGTGRTAAISFPLAGPHSEGIRNWPGYGNFLQTMGRWLIGDELPPGLGLRQQMAGTECQLDLMFDEEWEEKFAAQPPRIVLAEGERAEVHRELTWRRLAPGHFSTVADLSEGQLVRGVIQAGQHLLPFGPLAVGRQAEWSFDAKRVEELRAVAMASGGRELLDLNDAWKSPPAEEFADLRLWLLLAALLVMIAEALITRLGWRLPERAVVRKAPPPQQASVPARAKQPTPSPPPVPAISKAPEPAPEAPNDQQRKDRFARAKRK